MINWCHCHNQIATVISDEFFFFFLCSFEFYWNKIPFQSNYEIRSCDYMLQHFNVCSMYNIHADFILMKTNIHSISIRDIVCIDFVIRIDSLNFRTKPVCQVGFLSIKDSINWSDGIVQWNRLEPMQSMTNKWNK